MPPTNHWTLTAQCPEHGAESIVAMGPYTVTVSCGAVLGGDDR